MSDNPQPPNGSITVSAGLAKRIQEKLGENVYLCYQCVKCTSGCPVGQYFDWQPNQVMRAVQLGQEDIVLHAETPWLCASCQTCSTRCPQGLDIAAIMDFLTREALERGIKPEVPSADVFNKAFMREVRLWGRAFELGLMVEMKLRMRNFTEDIDLGLKLFSKSKLPFLPKRVRPPDKVEPHPDAAISVAYYPGCSLHATATEFDTSTRAVCEALDIKLIEPEGWNCCGSSAAHRFDPETAVSLPMANLALIEQGGFDEVTMPCAACFNRHKVAQYEVRHDETHTSVADQTVGYEYQDTVQVNTLIETITNRIGAESVAARVEQPLEGLRVVCYYGCLLTRPPQITEAEHPENPINMDQLMAALGAEVLDWSHKTSCCGAAHSIIRPDIARDLSSDLLDHAREVGADAMVVACPLCHTNLDARQTQMGKDEPLPVLYFTQLMALALGLPEKAAALNKNLIDPRPALQGKGVLS
jgi:heterodisulfide reductase subunit B